MEGNTAKGWSLLSADGHINEPPDLWTRDAPADLADRLPRVVQTEDGGDAWLLAPDLPLRKLGTSAVAGKQPKDYTLDASYKSIRPGSYDGKARLADMDIDGVFAEVLYPGQCRALDRFAGPEVRAYCAQRYNEWLAEMQSADSNRLIGLAVLPPIDDGPNAARELERAVGLGFRGAFQSIADDGLPLSHRAAEGVWEIANANGIPISLHVGSSRSHWQGAEQSAKHGDAAGGLREAMLTVTPMSIAEHLAVLIFGGVFSKYPDLKVVIAEGGIGWIPYVMQRMESVYDRHRHYLGSTLGSRPTEVFREHCYATFQEDKVGIALRNYVGVQNLMWASDYPHTDTTWPNSVKTVEDEFGDVPGEEMARITRENCAELYRIKMPSA